MKRFKCFTTIMQNNSSTDDDDNDKEDEDEGLTEPDREEDTENNAEANTTAEEVKIEVTLPEVNTIDSNFADSGYWKVDVIEDELDDLLADYE